ncbi:MAG: hypothetical protein WB760_26740 [Xanthobacteraceae bacterium]
MGNIVYAAAMSHAPGIVAFPEAPPIEKRERFFAAASQARQALQKASPEVLLIIAPDHFTNFFVDNMPPFCIGLNESYEGPAEEWLGLKNQRVKGAHVIACDILKTALDEGFDLSFSETLKLEHSTMVPLTLLTPAMDLPIVWIMLNCQVPPMPTLRRCWELGKFIRKVADRRPERFAILGTGGLSHHPGAPEMGEVDENFDREFLHKLEMMNVDSILSMPKERIDNAGFGAWEIRQWLTVAGAVPELRGQTLTYEAMREWDTGCAVTLFH